jgi:alpha-beta hydrolase superfamily lysophospholipase
MTVNALNLRGTSASPLSDDVKTVDLMAHVDDLQHVVSELITSGRVKLHPPAVIAHSFGGLVTMKALEDAQFREQVSAVALLCSVPPSGNAAMTARFLRTRLVASLKIVWGFVFKGITTNAKLCRELLFDDSVSDLMSVYE